MTMETMIFKKNIEPSQSIAGDVTITRQLWRDHVNNDI